MVSLYDAVEYVYSGGEHGIESMVITEVPDPFWSELYITGSRAQLASGVFAALKSIRRTVN